MTKKILFMAACCMLLTSLMTSCGGSNPESVVEELMDCLKNKDYEAAFQLVSDEEKIEQMKAKVGPQEVEKMINQAKADIGKPFKAGIKSYEITSREVDEKEEIGLFYVHIILDNDDELKQAISVVKNNKGRWIPGFLGSNYEHTFTLDEIKEFVKNTQN